MDIKDAIKYLNSLLVPQPIMRGDETIGMLMAIAGDHTEEVKMGISALAKQVPKKPKGEGWLYCGSCGLDILMQTDKDGNDYNYCPRCGQAIEWECNDECISKGICEHNEMCYESR